MSLRARAPPLARAPPRAALAPAPRPRRRRRGRRTPPSAGLPLL